MEMGPMLKSLSRMVVVAVPESVVAIQSCNDVKGDRARHLTHGQVAGYFQGIVLTLNVRGGQAFDGGGNKGGDGKTRGFKPVAADGIVAPVAVGGEFADVNLDGTDAADRRVAQIAKDAAGQGLGDANRQVETIILVEESLADFVSDLRLFRHDVEGHCTVGLGSNSCGG